MLLFFVCLLALQCLCMRTCTPLRGIIATEYCCVFPGDLLKFVVFFQEICLFFENIRHTNGVPQFPVFEGNSIGKHNCWKQSSSLLHRCHKLEKTLQPTRADELRVKPRQWLLWYDLPNWFTADMNFYLCACFSAVVVWCTVLVIMVL